jgi:ribosomal protein S18 acetylase RimI-like enzyme
MTNSSVVIRTAETADGPCIAELAARTFIKAFALHNDPADIDAYVSNAFSRDTILHEIEDANCLFFLAVEDGINIGYAKTRKGEPPECVGGPKPIELERIYVDASRQSTGVGALLMQEVFDYARHEGYETVWLGAWEKNPNARRFYERHGFVPVGSKYFMVGNDRQNDVVMRRILD